MSQKDNIDYFLFGSLFTVFFISCVVALASSILYSYSIIFFSNYITLWQVLFSWVSLVIISLVMIWTTRELRINLPSFVKSLVTGSY